MHDIMPYLALLVVILTGVGIVKKLQVNILLLFAGIALNLIAILGGVTPPRIAVLSRSWLYRF